MGKIGRNDPCPCGSGKKYKNCCIDKDDSFLNNSEEKIVSASSDFDYIIPVANKLNSIISKYKFEDVSSFSILFKYLAKKSFFISPNIDFKYVYL